MDRSLRRAGKLKPDRARWVSSEQWHGQQEGSFDNDGYYTLEVDYNQDPELVMDILKHGSEVDVIGPATLRNKVATELKKAAQKY